MNYWKELEISLLKDEKKQLSVLMQLSLRKSIEKKNPEEFQNLDKPMKMLFLILKINIFIQMNMRQMKIIQIIRLIEIP